jgi:hypothetical protein
MRLRWLAAWTVLAFGACSSNDETHVQCLIDCTKRVTFMLATPISGAALTIAVGESDGTVETLDCQPGDGSVACIPVPARLVPTFDASGALVSLELANPASGTLNVQIAVGGAPTAAASFQYNPVSTPPPSSDTCPGALDSCWAPQTFTIGN